ncbi:MAG: TonB family protein [Gallionella sp.]|nr:TonB family protein [Gallionella sp.]
MSPVLNRLKQPLTGTMAFSVALHVFALFGITLVMPDPRQALNFLQPLQVVLVNSKSATQPVKADALAQANLDGGGNTPEERQAKSPLPTLRDDPHMSPAQSARRVTELEAESKRMMTRLKNPFSVPAEKSRQQSKTSSPQGDDLVQKALEIARLEAQISKNYDAYQKMPRRKFIGARTQEYRFAQYIEDWRIKVERIGNLNYPEDARRDKLYGKLQVSVSIRADGSLESVEVSRSSGQRILDAAAVRIVRLAAPYAPLPPDITRDTDILTIIRTWTFTSTDKLESE